MHVDRDCSYRWACSAHSVDGEGMNPPSQTDIAKASAKGHSKVFLFKKKPFVKKGKVCGGTTNTQRYFLNLELITIKHSPNKTAKGVII